MATETHWNPASNGFVTLGKVSENPEDNEALPENTVSDSRKHFYLKLIAVLSMPLEGIFFFGILIGWPNLAELYKESGVYESVCDKYVTNVTLHGTINCPESQGHTYRIDFGPCPVWDYLIEIWKFWLIFLVLVRGSLLKEMLYFQLLALLVVSHIIVWHYRWDLFWINMEHSKPVQ